MSVVSKTKKIEAEREIEQIATSFQPLVRAIFTELQRKKLVGRHVKIGALDTEAGWEGVDYDFTA